MKFFIKKNKNFAAPLEKIFPNRAGFTIIEILVVIAIIVICLASLLGLSTFYLKISSLMKETNQANVLAQEAIEAVRNFRDGTSWNVDGIGVLSVNADYYPQISGSPEEWNFVLGSETVGFFERKVIFERVLRNSNYDIVSAGGVEDPDTRKVTATVSWKGREVKIVTYFTNWKN